MCACVCARARACLSVCVGWGLGFALIAAMRGAVCACAGLPTLQQHSRMRPSGELTQHQHRCKAGGVCACVCVHVRVCVRVCDAGGLHGEPDHTCAHCVTLTLSLTSAGDICLTAEPHNAPDAGGLCGEPGPGSGRAQLWGRYR